MTRFITPHYKPTHCPRCGKKSVLSNDSLQFDGTEGYKLHTCEKCGATWNEIYALAGFEDLTSHGEEVSPMQKFAAPDTRFPDACSIIGNLLDQIEQMAGMFDDEDGTIEEATDEALEFLKAHRP